VGDRTRPVASGLTIETLRKQAEKEAIKPYRAF
jgi:hypothetical protein